MKIQIDMTVSNPPLERILDVLGWLVQILINLARPKSDMISDQNIQEGGETIVVNLRSYN
jgi:hypothetical protein